MTDMRTFLSDSNAIAAALLAGAKPSGRSVNRGGAKPAVVPSAVNLEVLAFLRAYFAENDQLPSVSVVARRFGWALGSAEWHLRQLRRFGLVEPNAAGRLRFVRAGRAPVAVAEVAA